MKQAVAAFAVFLMILDPGTMVRSAREGVQLCLYTVIPSIFPFLVLTGVMGGAMKKLPGLARLCRIPEGAESVWLSGTLGGYPAGAACIAGLRKSGALSKAAAEHLLGFCCNASPAFLFGMGGSLFEDRRIPWLLWLIHLSSSLLTGVLLPAGYQEKLPVPEPSRQDVMKKAVRAMAVICGWIILFRVICGFLIRWGLWRLPLWTRVLTAGLLELSNGWEELSRLSSPEVQFLLASVMLGWGGACVWLQVHSICEGMSLRLFAIGRMIQTGLSALAAACLCPVLFQGKSLWLAAVPAAVFFLMILMKKKITGGNSSFVRV